MTWHDPPHLGSAGKKACLPGRQVILLDRMRGVRFEEGAFDEEYVCSQCQMLDPGGVFLMAAYIHDIYDLLPRHHLHDVTQGTKRQGNRSRAFPS